jgi:monovalent cation/hydrogen antiporter
VPGQRTARRSHGHSPRNRASRRRQITDRLRAEYQAHLQVLHPDGDDNASALRLEDQYAELRLALLARKRATLIRLRDERRIDDIVLRQVQARLDIEEVRLTHRELIE